MCNMNVDNALNNYNNNKLKTRSHSSFDKNTHLCDTEDNIFNVYNTQTTTKEHFFFFIKKKACKKKEEEKNHHGDAFSPQFQFQGLACT